MLEEDEDRLIAPASWEAGVAPDGVGGTPALHRRYNPCMPRMMVVTAHPDDEASSFGGSLRLYRERGVETCIVCLTPGQAATHRGGCAQRSGTGGMRRKEFAAACEILKVSRGIVLDYPDGQLHRLDMQRVVSDLTLRIREFRPQVLLTFDPAGGVTGPHRSLDGVGVRHACLPLGGTKQSLSRPADRLGHALPNSEAVPRQPPTSLCPDASPSLCRRPPLSSRLATIWKPRLRRSARTPASNRCGQCSKSMRASAEDESCSIWRRQ